MATSSSWDATGPLRQAVRGTTHHHGSNMVAMLERLRYVLYNTRGRLHRSHGPSRHRHPQPRSSAVRALHQHHHLLVISIINPPLLTDYTKGSRPTTTSRRVGSLFPYRYQHHSSTNDATSTIVSYRRRSTTPLSPLASRSLKIVHSLP